MEKINMYIFGRKIPALIYGDIVNTSVTLASGRTIPAQLAPVLSLRETNPDGPNPGVQYRTITQENLKFVTHRFDSIVGLDVSEDGTVLQEEELEDLLGQDIMARQLARQAAATAEVDL